MRRFLASTVAALIVVAAAPALAQAPPDTVTQAFRQKVAAGSTADKYEAGRKKHMAWHKAQGDPWTWNTYEVITGPDTGSYLIASPGHQWADFDTWQAKFGDADTVDANASMAGTQAGSQMTYWTQLNAISRLPAANTPPTPMLSLTTYHVKPGSDAAVMAAIGKISAAMTTANYPLHSAWYRLSNGGSPAYAVATPRANMGTFSNNVMAVLEKQLGKAASDALSKEFFDNVTGVTSELLQRRADLSYAP